jgi:hypothetical protein
MSQHFQGVLGMAPKGSDAIQAMLKPLAEEEEEQIEREKAVGSVDATKPLLARVAAY